VWDARTLEAAITLTDDAFVRAPPIVADPAANPIALINRAFGNVVGAGAAATHLVTALAFSPDGCRLASSWDDGTIRVFDASPKTPYQQARDLVNRFVNAGDFFKDEVIENIRADRTLSAETRDTAIRFVDARIDNPSALNSAAFRVVKTPDGDPEDYRLALRRAEAAAQLLQGQTTTLAAQVLNTVAFAQYRLGRFRDALGTVKRSSGIRPGDPNDLVVSAMAHQRLGERDAALADLAALDARLAESAKVAASATATPQERAAAFAATSPDLKVLVAEAKALVERPGRR
jgi:hypothetical protein